MHGPAKWQEIELILLAGLLTGRESTHTRTQALTTLGLFSWLKKGVSKSASRAIVPGRSCRKFQIEVGGEGIKCIVPSLQPFAIDRDSATRNDTFLAGNEEIAIFFPPTHEVRSRPWFPCIHSPLASLSIRGAGAHTHFLRVAHDRRSMR